MGRMFTTHPVTWREILQAGNCQGGDLCFLKVKIRLNPRGRYGIKAIKYKVSQPIWFEINSYNSFDCTHSAKAESQ